MPDFIPGKQLAGAYYAEVVSDLVGRRHAAALLGWGSDVLGFDTPRSTDHGWGPRLQIFAPEAAVSSVRVSLLAQLPREFRGWPTCFGWDAVEPRHHVDVTSLGAWLRANLGEDPRQGMTTRTWLGIPQQLLLGVIEGAIFSDPDGELRQLQEQLRWYPEDVWLWMIACQWQRISQEEAFVGRAAEVGDELGSRIVAARVIRDLMRLFLLLERRYAPYSKWLGSAFQRLPVARSLAQPFRDAMGENYTIREQGLTRAYSIAAEQLNSLGKTPAVDPTPRRYHGRPFLAIHAERFVEACCAAVTDPWLTRLPLVGSVDQFIDSADVLSSAARSQQAAQIYDSFLAAVD